MREPPFNPQAFGEGQSQRPGERRDGTIDAGTILRLQPITQIGYSPRQLFVNGCYASLVRFITFLVLLLPLLTACSSQTHLVGTGLGQEQAPGFRLRDEHGQAWSLNDFRGKVVVLSFLYTHCTDYCPLTAELIRHADEAAGRPNNVEYLAVSVDPAGDTPESIATFEQQHHLDELGNRWHYLIGSAGELSGVWRSYYIGVSPGLEPGESGHTSTIYFIDRQGRRRVLTDLDAGAEAIAKNALTLARG
jgi:protein SCO1